MINHLIYCQILRQIIKSTDQFGFCYHIPIVCPKILNFHILKIRCAPAVKNKRIYSPTDQFFLYYYEPKGALYPPKNPETKASP